MQGIHTTAKVVGALCNYDCQYCFYLEKDELIDSKRLMSNEILEQYIINYISSQQTPTVEFAWHGGEPTLIGLEFFELAVALQKKYAGNKVIKNTLQTNGSKITEEWCKFFRDNQFLVGLSLDGPEHIQAKYRTKRGRSAFKETYNALKLFQKFGVDYNVLACVTHDYCEHAEEIYQFFRENNVKHLQFSPVVEYLPSAKEAQRGQSFSSGLFLVDITEGIPEQKPTEWSVTAHEYGQFLIKVFDTWIKKDVGDIFISNFEQALTQYIGNPSPNCIHASECGASYAVESNGDVYFCDHVAYPESKMGNITRTKLIEIHEKSDFHLLSKKKRLSSRCKSCKFLKLCNGGCPKQRHLTNEGEYENHLCEGYFSFFSHVEKYLHAMTLLLSNGYPASYVMQALNGPLILKKNNQ